MSRPEPNLKRAFDLVMQLMAVPGKSGEERNVANAIVERLRAAKVPVVLTESGSTYDEDYRDVFEQVHGYLEKEYTKAGEVEYGGSRPLRVYVRADLTPARRYEPFDLPCFMP